METYKLNMVNNMKTFTIEIHPYPQEFTITAQTKHEAMDVARERFYRATNGVSIFETKVTNEEDF